MIVQSKWEIKNSFNGSKENYLLKFYLSFKIMNNKLDTFNIRRTTFHNSRLIRVDPFEFIPILKKPKILKEFDREFAKVINSFKFNFNDYNISGTDINFLAKDFLIARNKLMIFSKTLNKRRGKFPIHKLESSFQDFTLIVRKEHIYSSIYRIASQRNVELLSIEFKNGKILIESFGSKEKTFLHISVIGKVWMKHNIFIRNGYRNLNFSASWSSWKYRIKAKRCLGFCGEVMRKAKNQVHSIINENKYFSGNFMDTSSLGKNVRCRINTNGLKFYFNKK